MIGISTGALYKYNIIGLKEKVAICKSLSTDAIEIMFNIDQLNDQLWYDSLSLLELGDFKYKSLHLPNYNYDITPDTKTLIETIIKFDDIHHFDHFIIHPDLVLNWTVLKPIVSKLLIENMDNRRQKGITVEQMKDYVEIMNSSMILDINHTYSLDPTMELCKAFIQKLKGKIKEVHLSGYDTQEFHTLMSVVKQDLMCSVLKDLKDIPMIIESIVPENLDPYAELKKEIEYFQKFV